jgi:hypothetical protein
LLGQFHSPKDSVKGVKYYENTNKIQSVNQSSRLVNRVDDNFLRLRFDAGVPCGMAFVELFKDGRRIFQKHVGAS